MSQEKFPCHESLTVIKGITIYHTEKWWQAVLLIDQFGKKNVSVFLWQFTKGKWKRIHKLKISRADNWKKVSDAVTQLIGEL